MKKGIKKYQWGTFSASGATPEMVNPGNAALQQYTMSSQQTQGMPISTQSSADPNAMSLSDIKTPYVKKRPLFKDKAGAFMGKYGEPISAVAGTIMPMLMKKPNANAKPYKKGSKLIKYQDGEREMSLEEQATMVPEDLLSRKDRLISRLPGFLKKTLAKKSLIRYNKFQEELENAKKELGIKSDQKLDPFQQNRLTRQVLSFRNLEKERAEKEEEYNRELETEKIRKDAEESRLAYEDSLRKEEERKQEEEKNYRMGVPTSFKDYGKISPEKLQAAREKEAGAPISTEFKPILYKEEVKAEVKKEEKKAPASNRKKGSSNKPLVKMKKTEEPQKSPEDFWKKLYEERQPTLGKNFDRGQLNLSGPTSAYMLGKFVQDIVPENMPAGKRIYPEQINKNSSLYKKQVERNEKAKAKDEGKYHLAKEKQMANSKPVGVLMSDRGSKPVSVTQQINSLLPIVPKKKR